MPSLGLNQGWFVFSSISNFLSSLAPNDMPLSEKFQLFLIEKKLINFLPTVYCILELLRDAFQSKVSILHIILEVLKTPIKIILNG